MVLIKDINTTAVLRLLIAYYFISKKGKENIRYGN